MGCDVVWSCTETALAAQAKCAHSLQEVWTDARWDFDGFDEPEEGYFLNLDNRAPVLERTTLDLCGLSSHNCISIPARQLLLIFCQGSTSAHSQPFTGSPCALSSSNGSPVESLA
jgi:hypothetical protein